MKNIQKLILSLALLAVLNLSIGNTLHAFNISKYWREPVYRSSAVIEVIYSEPEALYVTESQFQRKASRRLGTVIQRMKSRSRVEDIMKELNLDKDVKNEVEYRELVEKIRNGIEVKEPGLNLLEISCVYNDPQVCRRIVNLLVRKFIKEQLEIQEKDTSAGLEFLNKEIELYKKKLEEASSALEEFENNNLNILPMLRRRSPTEVTLTPAPANTFADQYRGYTKELLDLGIELKTLKEERKNLEKELEKTDEMVVTSREIDQKTKEVLTVTSSLNPIYQEIKRNLILLRVKIVSHETKRDIIQKVMEELFEKMKTTPAKAKELAILERRYNNCSRIYSQLLEKREEAYLNRRLELTKRGTRIRIIDNASVPLKPYDYE